MLSLNNSAYAIKTSKNCNLQLIYFWKIFDMTKDVMQGKLIAVAYTLRTY